MSISKPHVTLKDLMVLKQDRRHAMVESLVPLILERHKEFKDSIIEKNERLSMYVPKDWYQYKYYVKLDTRSSFVSTIMNIANRSFRNKSDELIRTVKNSLRILRRISRENALTEADGELLEYFERLESEMETDGIEIRSKEPVFLIRQVGSYRKMDDFYNDISNAFLEKIKKTEPNIKHCNIVGVNINGENLLQVKLF